MSAAKVIFYARSFSIGRLVLTSVSSPINWILRSEGLAVFSFAIGMYFQQDYSWVTFAILFLMPDLSFSGYLINNKIGAIAYNTAHSYIGASISLAVGFFLGVESALLVGLIWAAHIGFDRALGYGLKYGNGFGFTHLGMIGKAKGT